MTVALREVCNATHGTCQAIMVNDPVYGTNGAAWCSGAFQVQDCNKKGFWSIYATVQ